MSCLLQSAVRVELNGVSLFLILLYEAKKKKNLLNLIVKDEGDSRLSTTTAPFVSCTGINHNLTRPSQRVRVLIKFFYVPLSPHMHNRDTTDCVGVQACNSTLVAQR